MKFVVLLLCVFSVSLTFAQTALTEAEAKEVIDVFFEGFHKGDTLKMRSVMAEDMVMQTASSDAEGNHKISNGKASDLLLAIANRPETQQWDERLLDYKVQIDGNLAHVWTPYEFWFNGQFSHCGANAFTLARTNAGWKILHLIDSRRKTDCGH
ncbi:MULTISPECIES: nuclear transport factor 2 family protein [Altibacter]|uniref:nuclear transport factor 2 family protein n=1 Tax=Altibacter TaxID=1535231 RepID=UPI0005591B24|nr:MULTISPECIES: nuclear transport factor 2 family protein [Altibacter]MCW8981120.1 nuclear transport factor 2 family protein [Altibacter sp.]MCW9038411.1 nuclear transport factor 2 family protein [Altibacter sp.]